MNRTIKFRGKDLKTGEWLHGDLVHGADGNRCAILVNSRDSYDECEVLPDTVGQFTGMYDHNGKEIYEGDILSWLFFHGVLEVGHVEYKREESQFRIVNRFSTRDGRECTSTIQNKRDLTVRGNIHDTPGLLKGGAQ